MSNQRPIPATQRTAELQAKVAEATRLAQSLPDPVKALEEVRRVAASVESLKGEDQRGLATAEGNVEKDYGWLSRTAWNPLNWTPWTELSGHKAVRESVDPWQADVSEDEKAFGKLGDIQQNLTKRIIGSEQGALLATANELGKRYDQDTAVPLIAIATEAKLSAPEVGALYDAALKAEGSAWTSDSSLAVDVVGLVTRTNAAREAAGNPARLSVEEGLHLIQRVRKDVPDEASATIAETILQRADALSPEGTAPASEAALKQVQEQVVADYRFFDKLDGTSSANSAVLTSLVGPDHPKREEVRDHWQYFYKQSGIGDSEATVMTALVAPYDGTDERPVDVRRNEVLADYKVTGELADAKKISSDDRLSTLAAYRDPDSDFGTFLLYYWFFNQTYNSNVYGSALASAGMFRNRQSGSSSGISSLTSQLPARFVSGSQFARRSAASGAQTAAARRAGGAAIQPPTDPAVRAAKLAGSSATVANRAAATSSRAATTANRAAANANRAAASATRAAQTASRAAATASRAAQTASRAAARSSASTSSSRGSSRR